MPVIFLMLLSVLSLCGGPLSARAAGGSGSEREEGAVTENPDAVAGNPEAPKPSRFDGTITWVDAKRHLVVLQEQAHLTALQVDLEPLNLAVGQRVTLQGLVSPLVGAFPAFPWSPAERQILPALESPTNRGSFYLVRFRGFVRPPTSGRYTFWIASDDSSELWLSSDADPANARRLAMVESGRWTAPRQWTRFSTQRSRKVNLNAGQPYYLEVLYQQSIGQDCLAVAWQGPGTERSVIDGASLSPWPLEPEGSSSNSFQGASHGVLWEYWTNFFGADLSALRREYSSVRVLRQTRLVESSPGILPQPMRLLPGQTIGAEENFCWAEVEGKLDFCGSSTRGVELELSAENKAIRVVVEGSPESVSHLPEHAWVRVTGVCEAGRNAEGHWCPAILWVNGAQNVQWLDKEQNWSDIPLSPMCQLNATNVELRAGQWIHVRGKLAPSTQAREQCLQGDDTFYGFCSSNGVDWVQMGPPVELAMSNQVLVGVAVTSHRSKVPTKADFDHLQGFEAPFRSADIGSPPVKGSCAVQKAGVSLRGGGRDIWDSSDQCFYAYRFFTGAGEFSAHLADLQSADSLGKAALMLRQSLDSQSPFAGMVLMSSRFGGMQARRDFKTTVAGSLAPRPGDWLRLVRRRNVLLVESAQAQLPESDLPLEALGRLEWRDSRPVLRNARFRLVANAAAAAENEENLHSEYAIGAGLRTVPIRDLATKAEAVRQAGLSPLFRIQGVVTFAGRAAGQSHLFVQDATAGCRVSLGAHLPPGCLHVGQKVELVGSVSPGGGTPEFAARGLTVAGEGAMPQLEHYSFGVPVDAFQPGQWAELEGVGRRLGAAGELFVMTREGLFPVWVQGASQAALEQFVDASLRLRGVCWTAERAMLLVPAPSFIQVREPAPTEAFGVPKWPISRLRAIRTPPQSMRRVRVAGIVTSRHDGWISVQDESGAAHLEVLNEPGIAVGDGIEAVGFPGWGAWGICIAQAQVRPLGRRGACKPIALAAADLQNAANSGLFVCLDATVLDQRSHGGPQVLDLQVEQRAFQAVLPREEGLLPQLVPGTVVRVCGVIQIEPGQTAAAASLGAEPVAASLSLLLRGAQDVTVVRSPPWWNWKHTAASLAVAGAGLVLALAWARTLRRQVEERTGQLRQTMDRLKKETRISATLAERDRLASEIHDSLEQGLSAIVMQMDAAAKVVAQPEEVSRYLAMARHMASFSRAEVKHAVWDLQSPMLENSDLGTALQRMVKELSSGDTPRVTVDICGQARPLLSAVEHHLLRMAQEAISNALTHARPTLVQVRLDYGTERVTLSVQDDGCGFDPQRVSVGNGHFGLQNLRVRARKLNAVLKVSSHINQGTRVEVQWPEAGSETAADVS